MANANLFVVDLMQKFGNEPIHNLFTYRPTTVGAALELAASFREDVLPFINAIQVNDILNVSVKVYSMGNLDDNWEDALTGGGLYGTANMLPLHDAVNYTLKPRSRAVRPGSKRFSGIPTEVTTDGVITSGTYMVPLNDLKVALSAEISDDEDNTFEPIIVKRVKYVPDPERPDHFAYRYPLPTDPEATVSVVGAVLLNTKISHQDSRGNGK